MPTNRFPDEEIAPVASAMRQILEQQPIGPDDHFVTALGQKLAAVSIQHASGRPLKLQSTDGFRVPLVPERQHGNRIRTQFAAVLTIMVMLAGSAFFALRSESTDHSNNAPVIANSNQSTPNPLATGGIRWSIPGSTGPDVSVGEIAVGGGVLYRALTRPDFSGIQAYATENGSLLWEIPLRNTGELIADDDGLIVVSRPDGSMPRVVRLKGETGEELWSVYSWTQIRDVLAQDGMVIIQNASNELQAANTETGHVVWQTGRDNDGDDSTAIVPQLVSAPGIVIALSGSHGLTAYNPQTGEALWSLSGIYANQIAISDHTVAMIEGIYPSNSTLLEGQITGYSTDDGTKLWQRTISVPSHSPMPTLTTDADGFALVANKIGMVIISRPQGATPRSLDGTPVPYDLSSNTLIMGNMEVPPPPFAVAYGLSPEYGGITWFSRIAEVGKTQGRSITSAIWLIAAPMAENYRGYPFVSTIDGRVGWLVGDTGTSQLEPASRMFVGPDYDLPLRIGAQIDQVVVDLMTAYIKTENGTVIALDSGSL
jgi:hypothetical protein